MSLDIKQHDTYPALTVVFYEVSGQPLDLNTATAVTLIMRGASTGAAVGGTLMKLPVDAASAQLADGSSRLTEVSNFAQVANGSSLLGTGVPAGARVGAFDPYGATIDMIDEDGEAAAATGDGPTTLMLNLGTATRSWLTHDLDTADAYNVEFEIGWPAGKKQTVPSTGYGLLTVHPDLDGS